MPSAVFLFFVAGTLRVPSADFYSSSRLKPLALSLLPYCATPAPRVHLLVHGITPNPQRELYYLLLTKDPTIKLNQKQKPRTAFGECLLPRSRHIPCAVRCLFFKLQFQRSQIHTDPPTTSNPRDQPFSEAKVPKAADGTRSVPATLCLYFR